MSTDEIVFALLGSGRLSVTLEAGFVWSSKANNQNKPLGSLTKKGYLRTCINFDGHRIFPMLHRVIWIAANGVPPRRMTIDHLNGVKSDNRLCNLELVDSGENMRRGKVAGAFKNCGREPDAPRDKRGRYIRIGKKAAGHLLDGRTWQEFPVQPTGNR